SGGGYNFTKGFVRGKKLAEYLVTGDRRWNFATPLSESMHEWTVKSYPMTALYKKYTYSYFWENVGKKILPESNKSVTVHGDLTQDVLNNLGGVASNRPIVRLIPQVASTTIRTSSTSIVFDKEVLIAFIGSDINKVHLEINNNIEVAPGAQLVFIVSGNVRLSKNVTRLDGIYIIDGQLVDLYDWVPGDESPYQKQLFGEGSIMTWGGFDLGNTGGRYREFPHEATYQFTFAPKYLVMISELLGERDYLWAEINP
ncbi:MAG TPA: hypothetical protein VJ179_02930, partial [Patescibacteria group bacterium]|nr:hypothetical protein [Patescibacteria group bacterium]